MAQPFITVTGLKEVQRMLRNAPIELRRETAKAMKTAAAPIRSDAQGRASRTARGRATGRLAGSVKLYARSAGVAIGSPLVYAPVVQFGRKSRQRSAAGNYYTRTLTPTDYLLAAINANAHRVVGDVERTVQRTLDRLTEGL